MVEAATIDVRPSRGWKASVSGWDLGIEQVRRGRRRCRRARLDTPWVQYASWLRRRRALRARFLTGLAGRFKKAVQLLAHAAAFVVAQIAALSDFGTRATLHRAFVKVTE